MLNALVVGVKDTIVRKQLTDFLGMGIIIGAENALTMVDKTRVENIDCMEGMKQFPDKYFDLAIVDPPYGIDWMGQIENPNVKANWKSYQTKQWDKSIPDSPYFQELKRVSNNQIIWGGNYMTDFLYPSSCWIIWDKMQEFSGAVFEMAWTSFKSPAKAFRMSRVEAYANQNKIHPTQKPVPLYKWLLKNYAKEGDKILDSHVGSGSSRIAAYDGGFEYVGYELDTDYFNAQEKRFAQHKQQFKLFTPDQERGKPKQLTIW